MGIKFQTDQSGANNNVCTTTSQTFNFSLARSAILDSASFSLKKGSGTTASIVVAIHDQPNGGGSIVESVTVLATNITQVFSDIVFTFSGNTTLNAGTSYSLVVSSSTSCTGNNPYSIKVGNFQVLDSGGGIINTGYGIGATTVCDTTITSSANASYLITSSADCINSLSCDTNSGHNISCTIENNATISGQATKINNNVDNRKIKLDGANIPIKIYLGNQKRRIYHANRMIIDKT